MKHYLMMPTWRCQNACPYCWLNETVRTRRAMMRAPEQPVSRWLEAVERDRPDLLDIAGGEPTLWPGLLSFIDSVGVNVGLSTNGLYFDAIAALAERKRANLVSITLSLHPRCLLPAYAELWTLSYGLLSKAGYRVLVNVVNWQDNEAQAEPILAQMRAHNKAFCLSPFEQVADLAVQKAVGLTCQGGISHKVIAPDGETWPCLSTLRSPWWESLSMGNWLEGTDTPARRVQPCHLACVDYYVLKGQHVGGDVWGVDAKGDES